MRYQKVTNGMRSTRVLRSGAEKKEGPEGELRPEL